MPVQPGNLALRASGYEYVDGAIPALGSNATKLLGRLSFAVNDLGHQQPASAVKIKVDIIHS
jgi:hypothetical protein